MVTRRAEELYLYSLDSWHSARLCYAHLVTGGTPRLQSLGVVAAAVEGPVLVEIDEVHHEFLQEREGGGEDS